MRTAFCCLAILAGVNATVLAEANVRDAAKCGAEMAIEWLIIPRIPLAAEDPEGQAGKIWNKAMTAIFHNDMSRALTIQQQLAEDLEMLEEKHGKQKYGAATTSARLRLRELKAISNRSSEIQDKYRLAATKMHEGGSAFANAEYDVCAQRAFETLKLLDEIEEPAELTLSITTRQNLGILLMVTGNPGLAIEHLRKNAELQKNSFGEQHPEYLYTVLLTGYALLDLKDYIQAESYLREYMINMRAQQAIKPFEYARGMAAFAAALIGQQKYTEAESLTMHAASMIESLKAEKQNAMAVCRRNLGLIAMATGDYKLAEQHFGFTLQMYKNGTNVFASDVIYTIECYIALKKSTNEMIEAESAQKKIHELRKLHRLSDKNLLLAGKANSESMQ